MINETWRERRNVVYCVEFTCNPEENALHDFDKLNYASTQTVSSSDRIKKFTSTNKWSPPVSYKKKKTHQDFGNE